MWQYLIIIWGIILKLTVSKNISKLARLFIPFGKHVTQIRCPKIASKENKIQSSFIDKIKDKKK